MENFENPQKAIGRFKELVQPKNEKMYTKLNAEFQDVSAYLHSHGYYIVQFPYALSQKLSLEQFAYSEIRSHIQSQTGDTGSVAWDERRKLITSLDFIQSNNSTNLQSANKIKEHFNNKYIESEIDLMRKLAQTNPTNAIGKSKELLESCFKHILDKSSIEYSNSDKFNQLRKKTFVALNLDLSENISAKNNEDVKKILNSFVQIVEGLNSLRNDKGDGHGKGISFQELPTRYAELAINSSFAIVQFVWETFEAHGGKSNEN